VLNKVDLVGPESVKQVVEAIGRDKNIIPFSVTCATPEAVEAFKQKIWDTLGLIRVYLKPKGGKPDTNKPMILRRGDTIESVCKQIHKDFVRKFRYAVVTGKSVRFADQTAGLTHKLIDEDIVTLVVER
jgi:ribosome-interacting GTPase 1